MCSGRRRWQDVVFGLAVVHFIAGSFSNVSCGLYNVDQRHHPATSSTTEAQPDLGGHHRRTHQRTNDPLPSARRIRSTAVEATENPDTPIFCERFESPNMDNRTFFSPLDPRSKDNMYPTKIDCTFVLTAPQGYTIQLDFRNTFNIEPSPGCEFDYLEVHDGQHGFSKELGRFCGSDFPQIVHSSDRYMWLHFHSDDNIEYEGFQAVFDYILRPTTSAADVPRPLCSFNREGPEGYITKDDIDAEIIAHSMEQQESMDCLWRIEVPENWKILLTFDTFNLHQKNDCESNFVDIFGNITDIPSRLKNFCGVIAESVVSKSNVLHVRFFAEYKAITDTNFKMLYTAFRQKKKGTECDAGEFDCDDDTCIDESLVCNDHVNCKFPKDDNEIVCKKESSTDRGNLIIIIVVFCLILSAMIAAFLFNCIRKLVRDQKIIREHIRQSKESKLDEAGQISMKRSLENINRIMPSNQSVQPMQRNIHKMDSDSARYYHETKPKTVAESGNRIDVKNDNNFRNLEIKDSFTSSLQSEKNSSEHDGDDGHGNNMCDIACQTRSSLFRTTPSQSHKDASSSVSHGPLRFSTFGYADPRPNSHHPSSSETTASSSPHQQPAAHQPPPTQPPHQHHHHHHHHDHHQHQQHQQHHAHSPAAPMQQQQHTSNELLLSAGGPLGFAPGIGGGGGRPCTKHNKQHPERAGGQKKTTEESRIYVDIRNSAPDVIIMTSH